jgi:hypothetical protein
MQRGATPLPYRPKGKGVGLPADWSRTAAHFTFVTLAVLLGVGAVGFSAFALSDLTSNRGMDWVVVGGAVGCGAGVAFVAILGRSYLYRQERARRNAMLYCDRCGYDLRASFDRCSECGHPIPIEREEVVRRLRALET